MIDILVPVLGRPQRAQPLVDNIEATTTVEHRIVFLCSHRDESGQIEACDATGNLCFIVDGPDPGDYARKINFGVGTSANPFLFAAADDLEFTAGWDHAILAEAERTGAGMVGCDDDANPMVKKGRHSTHSLFRRDYIDRVGGTFFDGPGIVYHEGYDHQCVDNEAVKAAQDRGEWAFARRAVVRHHHPLYSRTVRMDATYERGLRRGREDIALYQDRLRRWTRRDRTTVL